MPPAIKRGIEKKTFKFADFPLKPFKTSIYRGFAIATFDYQRVLIMANLSG